MVYSQPMQVRPNQGTLPSSQPRQGGHSLSLDPSRLRFLTPDGGSARFPVDGSIFTIGSDPECGLRWEGPRVQPVHAQARWQEGKLWVRDGGSGTTLVDGVKVSAQEWTPMRDGGHLQLGTIADPSLSLAMVSTDSDSFQSSQQPLLVTFFGDASEPDISRHVRGQPARFETMIEKTRAPVQVSGVVAEGSKTSDAVHTIMPFAMGATAAAGAFTAASACLQAGPVNVPLLVFGGLMAAVGGLGARLSWQDSREHAAALGQKRAPAQDSVPPWKHVSQQVIRRGPSASDFKKLWQGNLRDWPNSRQVVYISGHGLQQSAASLSYESLAETVHGAEALVLDVCNGGQLESLSRLTGSARVAVVSEHTVRGFGFPLESMFGQASFPSEPRAFGATLLRAAAKGRPAKSLVAVDLQALEKQLLPSLDRLGRNLSRLSQRGYQQELHRLLDESETTDADDYGSTVDLGSFLSRLEQQPALAASCPELARTSQALNETLLGMLGHGTLSFNRRSAPHLPEGWRRFLRDHRK